ncbi:hypothetical protein DMB65_04390 [Flavobacterium cheongpyeongense]|uniref:Uncharacterized protein n=1 Tax=Flavobacterium cheongpyeongense TaxID=2212651 RepID=A0A2V4BS73_9FLAO|nr:hypothetical protein [Flavobacterium cheongpyeongense]PXY41811.1 hypothetical protein DMB65_04390 [Flavobacterium cheongpyeongense]
MKTISDIPRNLNKDNINETIEAYKLLLADIPLKIEESNLLALLNRLKRGQIGSGPWKNVSIFEAANRIMTDLVILFGVKKIINGEYPDLNIFTDFEVELGNENRNDHDIISYANDKVLIAEAFNVAPSFFNVKKSKSVKKLLTSKLTADHLILFCNADSHDRTKLNDNIEIIKVDIVL